MSLENSINEMAAAIRMLAESISGAARANAHGQIAAALGDCATAVAEVVEKTAEVAPITVTLSAEDKKAIREEAKRDAELEKAVEQVEAEAKKPAGSAENKAPANTAGSVTEPATLDYEKDVKPVLIKYASAKGKPELSAFVKSFGVDKATELKPEQLADVLAQANAALAA